MSTLDAQTLARSRVIAKGNRIREVERLVDTYGGSKAKWLKKSGPPFQVEDTLYEFHWYEHPGIGRFEVRRKEVNKG